MAAYVHPAEPAPMHHYAVASDTRPRTTAPPAPAPPPPVLKAVLPQAPRRQRRKEVQRARELLRLPPTCKARGPGSQRIPVNPTRWPTCLRAFRRMP
jgi:hypothetical protein